MGQRTFETDLVKALLEPLALLILTEAPRHGWGIAQDLGRSEIPLRDSSTLYRVLQEMEDAKLVRSKWQVTGRGPARRVYHITQKGRETLRRDAGLAVQFLERFEGHLRTLAGTQVAN